MVGAAVIGILFGFVLQRGSFCGSSLLSSVVLYKETKGLVGVAAAISVSMIGFAVLVHFGSVILNPNPMRLLSAIVGGLVFGIGMVLAGGCVTGTLYKAGEGRLTSMLALIGIGLGSAATSSGALQPLKRALVVATKNIRGYTGLQEVFDLPYEQVGGLLGIIGLLVIFAGYFVRRRSTQTEFSWSFKKLLSTGWSPVTAGTAIGILGWIAYVSSSGAGRNYPLGGHGGVEGAFSLLINSQYSGSQWTIFMVGGIIAGSAISARLRGSLKLRSADASTLLVAIFGGFLVGIGAALGRGCFIGNSVSGLALLSLHSFVFAISTVAANWVTTVFYLKGIERR